MKYSQIKYLKSFCAGLHSSPDWKEVIEEIENYSDDFEVNNVRFIKSDCIDKIQQDELESDLYLLGCFNSDFIAEVLSIDSEVIDSMQEAEAFESIGLLIVRLGKLEELQEAYASLDGYGHHFNTYDFSEKEETFNCTNYHIFDNR